MAVTPNPQKKIDLQAFRHHLATMPLPPLQDMPQQELPQINDASAQPSTWDKVLGSGGAILEGITLAPGGFYSARRKASPFRAVI